MCVSFFMLTDERNGGQDEANTYILRLFVANPPKRLGNSNETTFDISGH
jgi:hypothetical protein